MKKIITISVCLMLSACQSTKQEQPVETDLEKGLMCYSMSEYAMSELVETRGLRKWIGNYDFFVETKPSIGAVEAVVDYNAVLSVETGHNANYVASKDGRYLFGYQTHENGAKHYVVGQFSEPDPNCYSFSMDSDTYQKMLKKAR